MSSFRVITSYLLTVLLTLNSWPLVAAAATQSQAPSLKSRGQLLEDLNLLASNLQTLQSYIDRSQFDPDELLTSLDYDDERIITFVKEEIGLDVYPGTLRGAQGTLMSGAGNALDQSILLAKLLKDAGFEARIARATISDQQARFVVQEMRHPRAGRPPVFVTEKLEQTAPALQELKILGSRFGLDLTLLDLAGLSNEAPDISKSPAYGEAVRTAASLKQQLQSANIKVDDPGSSILVKDASDYFWVQYQLGPGTWENAHPAFKGEAPFQPEFEMVFAESIPPELQHRFSVQVFIESANGQKLEARPVSAKWERPTANLTSVPLVFGNLPNTLLNSSEMVPDLRAAVKEASWFVPVFEGGLAPESDFFDKNGTLIDPMAAGDPAAGIFQKVGDLFGKATEEIGGAGSPALTAQWLEFTFTSPNGEVRQHRRMILDRIGLAARQSDGLAEHPGPVSSDDLATLLQRHTMMLSTGETPRALAVDFAIENFLESRALLEQLLAGTRGEKGAQVWSEQARKAPQYWNGHLGLFTLLDMSGTLSDDRLIYRSGPSLVVHTEGFSGMDSFVRAIDIVQNPRRAIDISAQLPSLDPSALIAPGVWESIHEGVLLGPSGVRLNTMSVFRQADKAGAKVQGIPPHAATDSLAVDENSKAAIRTDLEKGFAVIVPVLDQPDEFGWWRIDPRSGETLGQIADGRGGAVATEYLEGLALGISISLLAVGLVGCMQSYDPPTLADVDTAQLDLACCLIANAILFACGFLIKTLSYAMAWDAYWSQQSICQG